MLWLIIISCRLTLAGIIALQANIRGFNQVRKYSKIQSERSVAATKIQSLFRTNIYFDVRQFFI